MQFLRQVPNILTAARLPAVVLITVWTHWAGVWASAALALFIVAALTDVFDGWIARKLDAVSDFGRLMDALVDKIFILGLLVGMAATDCLPVTRWDDVGRVIAADPDGGANANAAPVAPDAAPVDLLAVAGAPVLRRLVPVLLVVAAVAAVVIGALLR